MKLLMTAAMLLAVGCSKASPTPTNGNAKAAEGGPVKQPQSGGHWSYTKSQDEMTDERWFYASVVETHGNTRLSVSCSPGKRGIAFINEGYMFHKGPGRVDYRFNDGESDQVDMIYDGKYVGIITSEKHGEIRDMSERESDMYLHSLSEVILRNELAKPTIKRLRVRFYNSLGVYNHDFDVTGSSEMLRRIEAECAAAK